MTTIAYKDGVIAADGRIVQGMAITSDDFDKRIMQDGIAFFLSGAVGDQNFLIDCYRNGPPSDMPDADVDALVVDEGELYEVGASFECYYCVPNHRGNPMALGSGSLHALTAMDLGCSAREAVKMAAKRDAGTGGKIRTYKV